MPILPEVENVTTTALESLVLFALQKAPNGTKAIHKVTAELMTYINSFADAQIKISKEAEKRWRDSRMARADWHDSSDVQLWAEKFIEMHKGMVVGTDVNATMVSIDAATIMSWFANFWAVNERPFQKELYRLRDIETERDNLRIRVSELEEAKPKHNEMASRYAGTQVDPEGNGRVMTPPRGPDYGKPYANVLDDPGLRIPIDEDEYKCNWETPVEDQIVRAKQKSAPFDATTTSTTSYIGGKPVKDNPQA